MHLATEIISYKGWLTVHFTIIPFNVVYSLDLDHVVFRTLNLLLSFVTVLFVCYNWIHNFFAVETSVEIRFHIPSATWVSDAIKEKLFKRVRFLLLHCAMYEGHSINKLQNSIRHIRFVGNLILSSSCEFYYDDITVTSFINIKYGNNATEIFS